MSSQQATNSGIVTDETSGERHIPSSTRADGSTRKAIKIRPGYRPPEDVEVYKNRTAETFRRRQGGPIPGAEGFSSAATGKENNGIGSEAGSSGTAASNKNAKRREARKKAKAAGGNDDEGGEGAGDVNGAGSAGQEKTAGESAVDPDIEKEKKARNLKKKLKQARELQSKKDGGESLLPEQIAKVIKINELVRELEALGIDADDEKQPEGKGKADDAGKQAAT